MNIVIKTHPIENRIDCFSSWYEGDMRSGIVRGRLCTLSMFRFHTSHGHFLTHDITTYNDFYYHGGLKQFMQQYYTD